MRSETWREAVAAAVVAGLVVVVLWILTENAGAVGIARSDDWSYLLTQFEFGRSGDFLMNNWAVTMLIGQTLLAAPVVAIFGESIAALQTFVAVLSFLALVATYAFLRSALSRGWSWFALLVLATSPVFGPSVVSFMTDVPALLFLSLSLLLGLRAFSTSSVGWWTYAASGFLGLVAFTFRDYAIIGIVAVTFVGFLAVRRVRERGFLVVGLVLVAAVAAGLYAWRHSLPNDLRLDGWDLGFSIQLAARALLTVALLALPALAVVTWWRLGFSTKTRTAAAWVLAFAAAGLVVVIARFELLGNVIHPYGTTWLVSGGGVRTWPLWVNRTLIVLAALCLVLALFLAMVSGRRLIAMGRLGSAMEALCGVVRVDIARAILIVFPLLLLLAHASATILLGTWWIDRYFILVLPFLAGAIVVVARDLGAQVSGPVRALPGLALVGYAIWGLYVVDFDARFDGARWSFADELVSQGYAPSEIDGGMQWVSFHASGIGLGAQQVPTRPGRNWWTERYPDQRVCVTVSALDSTSARPPDEVGSMPVRTLFGREYVLVARPGPDQCL